MIEYYCLFVDVCSVFSAWHQGSSVEALICKMLRTAHKTVADCSQKFEHLKISVDNSTTVCKDAFQFFTYLKEGFKG